MNRYLHLFSIFLLATISSCNDSNTKKTYYPNGEIQVEFTVDANLKKDGFQKDYWENGNLKGVYEWKHGIANGLYRDYFLSGKPSAIAHFSNGLQDSAETIYYVDGRVHTICIYNFGKRNGKFYSFYQDGKTEMIADCRNDTTIRSIQFDSISSKVISFNVGPNEINIPKEVQLTDNNKMNLVFDTSYIRYVDVSIEFYKSDQDYFDGKPPMFNIPAVKTVDGFSFQLPDGIREGEYFVPVKIVAINPATDHQDITFLKRIKVLQ